VLLMLLGQLLVLLDEDRLWLERGVSFLPSRSPTYTSAALLPSLAGRLLLCATGRRICTGEFKALVATACLKNQPGPGT
jgi:hypothetical protein